MTKLPIGARVRRFGTLPPIPGTVVGIIETSDLDGGDRQRVRWDMPGSPVSAWDPALLYPLESDPIADPDEVISGTHVWRHPRLYPVTARLLDNEISLFTTGRVQATPVPREEIREAESLPPEAST